MLLIKWLKTLKKKKKDAYSLCLRLCCITSLKNKNLNLVFGELSKKLACLSEVKWKRNVSL